MSQHHYRTTTPDGTPVEILAGWDRPLQGFFLVVEDEREDEYVYSNLDDPALASCGGLPARLEYFQAKLAGLGLALPQAVWDEIRGDARANRGNRDVEYDGGGRIVSDRCQAQ